MNKLAITSLCAAVLLLAGCEDKNKDGNYTGTNYKVESFDGVPFITADGNPVRGRMFYGSFPGDKRKVVGDQAHRRVNRIRVEYRQRQRRNENVL